MKKIIKIIIIIIIIAIIISLPTFVISPKKETTNNTSDNIDISNYFVLYDGCEIDIKTGIQNLSEMEINAENTEKYNTTYYNYENGKYIGETQGTFGEETYEGVSIVTNTGKIAISKKYDAIPRTYTTVNELPKQLENDNNYESINLHSIDLNNDGKTEYIACCINSNEKAISTIMLLDNNYDKICNLVNLKNGFWGNISKEDKKVFLSLDDIDYIDIDNDGIIELLIKIPTYEGTKISIVKYSNNKIEGQTDIEASVVP